MPTSPPSKWEQNLWDEIVAENPQSFWIHTEPMNLPTIEKATTNNFITNTVSEMSSELKSKLPITVMNKSLIETPFKNAALAWKWVGSSYICDCWDNDIDNLVLLNPGTAASVIKFLENDGWTNQSDHYPIEDGFVSMKLEYYPNGFINGGYELNLILTENSEFYNAFAKAADACKTYKLSHKEARIMVHKEFLKPYV